jgi:hypothetical protein
VNFQLNKWYLDFSSAEEIGFYYVMSLHAGLFKIGYSAIHHYSRDDTVRTSKISRLTRETNHRLTLSVGELVFSPGTVLLKLDHERVGLRGEWLFTGRPIKMIKRPLIRQENGWCDWTVWTPFARSDVNLILKDRHRRIVGTGYIDFVRFAFPFWRVPFTKLYWGRLHGDKRWVILFLLIAPQTRMGLYADGEVARDILDVEVVRDAGGRISAFNWDVSATENGAKETPVLRAEVVRHLEDQDLLNSERVSGMVPRRLRRWAGSFGVEEKVEVKTVINGRPYRGIMEEVRWREGRRTL